jgi:type III restriction enzyme
MPDDADDTRTAQHLAARLSLRRPQRESLDILADLLGQLTLHKDPDLAHWLRVVQSAHPTVQAFEREFPSLCFSIATGVGKTRLMGAMIAWLLITGRSRHFFVLAPNLTIYEKLKQDFSIGSPKYVFAGVPELAQTPPVIVTGDDYTDGRGVRLDYAVPATISGDLFGPDSAPHINIFNIAKINARDNKLGAARSNTARVRRFQEYLGHSYFDYLASLPDLVVLMDEAHRYYASAGAQAINGLRPVLGIELTATPKTAGTNPRPFRNIVYHYPLVSALADGFVKVPAVATRRDFHADGLTSDELERIKLEDGIHHHEFVKVALLTYARQHDTKLVKPFMLVVAQDTAHAAQIKARVESTGFFGGRYKGRVIEVHSNLTGEESDESMQRLLAVEHDDTTEVVIHVNKLKEGWDVTNLYTIVPLRASASEILTEQTIGRGLRLPYGKRTGEIAVDRLTIIAHDRFQEIIDRANDPNSILRDMVLIGNVEPGDIPTERPHVLTAPSLAETYATGRGATRNDVPLPHDAAPLAINPVLQRIAEATLAAISRQATLLPSSRALMAPEVLVELERQVRLRLDDAMPAQASLLGVAEPNAVGPDGDIAATVRQVTRHFVEMTIDIPRIAVLPTREVNYGFEDFELSDLDRINFQPTAQELVLQHLDDNRRDRVAWREGEDGAEQRFEDYIVRHLVQHDAIDYDAHADLLYKLAGQAVGRLRSYLPDDLALQQTVVAWQQQLAEVIWTQMQQHRWSTPTAYRGRVTQGFDVLKPAIYTFAAGEHPRPFREPLPRGSAIRMQVFTGFSKCCYPYQKFQSDEGERRLAQVLEDDPEVQKWMKPAPGHFRIEWDAGRDYEPDFVAELADRILLIEPKQASEMESPEVIAKARAAARWCEYASKHARLASSKPWHYLLVPHDAISLGSSVSGLQARFCRTYTAAPPPTT